MSSCNNDCSSCASNGNCAEQKIEKLKMQEGSSVKKVIGVISGKGGVGKSFTASYLAVLLTRMGYRVGVLDADITGPSIPHAFGITAKALGSEKGIFPAVSRLGIKIISANMLLDSDSDPIVWRGPMIGNLIEQFYTDVIWEELDFLVIDMPPGTSDVALTVFQKIPVDSLVLVATPQSLVNLIVEKSAKMAEMMRVKIEGLVTNMSYVVCPKCGESIKIYGDDLSESIAKSHDITLTCSLPFDTRIASSVDSGAIEELDVNYLNELAIGLVSSVS